MTSPQDLDQHAAKAEHHQRAEASGRGSSRRSNSAPAVQHRLHQDAGDRRPGIGRGATLAIDLLERRAGRPRDPGSPTRTPPTSVLWMISGDTTLSTTGYPTLRPADRRLARLSASPAVATGIP